MYVIISSISQGSAIWDGYREFETDILDSLEVVVVLKASQKISICMVNVHSLWPH